MRTPTRRSKSDPSKYSCSCCHEYKTKDEFYPDAGQTIGISGYCKMCTCVLHKRTPSKGTRPVKGENTNRNKLEGFIHYFSKNQYNFFATFGEKFTRHNAFLAFTGIKNMEIDVGSFSGGYAPGCARRSSYAPHI
jgi:hypothetical protein